MGIISFQIKLLCLQKKKGQHGLRKCTIVPDLMKSEGWIEDLCCAMLWVTKMLIWCSAELLEHFVHYSDIMSDMCYANLCVNIIIK